jgi:hypothetical protein
MNVEEGEIRSRCGQNVKYEHHKSDSGRQTVLAVQSIQGMACWENQLPITRGYDLVRFSANGDPVSGDPSQNAVDNMLSLCMHLKIDNPHLLGHSMACMALIKYCRQTISKVHFLDQASKERGKIGSALDFWQKMSPRSATFVTPVLGFPKKEELFLPPNVFLFLEPQNNLSNRENLQIHRDTLTGPHTTDVHMDGRVEDWTHFPFQKNPSSFNSIFMNFLEKAK